MLKNYCYKRNHKLRYKIEVIRFIRILIKSSHLLLNNISKSNFQTKWKYKEWNANHIYFKLFIYPFKLPVISINFASRIDDRLRILQACNKMRKWHGNYRDGFFWKVAHRRKKKKNKLQAPVYICPHIIKRDRCTQPRHTQICKRQMSDRRRHACVLVYLLYIYFIISRGSSLR